MYHQPDLTDVRRYARKELDNLWGEYKRQLNPQEYPVDLSQKLYNQKLKLIQQIHHSFIIFQLFTK
ncbi:MULTISPECIES: hypothetical protein [Lactobacillaceae]|uniref:hypothetical protein n=1 Tax=Lactobacillaceae TaxID=33958 RepID=UPI0021F0E894|nr:hypothetical protein [Lactiplantibacillus plantarum]